MSVPGRDRQPGRIRRWLRPGTGVSGWLIVVFAGQLLLAVAGAIAIRMAFRDVPSNSTAGRARSTPSALCFMMRSASESVIGLGRVLVPRKPVTLGVSLMRCQVWSVSSIFTRT